MSHTLRAVSRCLVALLAASSTRRPRCATISRAPPKPSASSSGSAFDALAEAIAVTNANNIPVISASAGFTYRYNPQLEVFERSAETLGPIFLERPQTLGQGKFNVNLSWQYVEYNEFDGQSLRNLHGNGPIVLRNVDARRQPARLRGRPPPVPAGAAEQHRRASASPTASSTTSTSTC